MAKETKICQKILFENWKYIPNKNYFSFCYIYIILSMSVHTYGNNNTNNTLFLNLTYTNLVLNKKVVQKWVSEYICVHRN